MNERDDVLGLSFFKRLLRHGKRGAEDAEGRCGILSDGVEERKDFHSPELKKREGSRTDDSSL